MKKGVSRLIVALLLAVPTLFAALLGGCTGGGNYSFNWVLSVIKSQYYWGITDDYEYNGSIKDFVATYLDIYSDYYTREEYIAKASSDAGNKSGVGISYIFVDKYDDETWQHPDEQTGALIETVMGNSPAYMSGLKRGELITSGSYNGVTTQFDSAESFTGFIDARADGERFVLYSAQGGEHEMYKAEYTASYCSMSTKTTDYSITYSGHGLRVQENSGGMSVLPDGAAYMRLEQFYGNAPAEMAALMQKFNAENCTSLILDLRGNGGGFVDLMRDISVIYVGQLQNPLPNVMVAEDKKGNRQYTPLDKSKVASNYGFTQTSYLPVGTEVSVLADNGTASASEALIGVLIENGVIDYSDIYISEFTQPYLKLTGTENKNGKTYGKGIMQSTFVNYLTKEALKLTTAKIYWPNGVKSIHDVGLTTEMGCHTL
ncbi:MAG: hypothetical protein K2N47_04725, partial [Clostridia bacterium]|nr:hypothetical protein [Clostridia bacterium]